MRWVGGGETLLSYRPTLPCIQMSPIYLPAGVLYILFKCEICCGILWRQYIFAWTLKPIYRLQNIYICQSVCSIYWDLLLLYVIYFCPDFEPACSIYCFGVEICCCFLSRLCRQYLKMGYWQLLCWKYQTSCCQTQKATIVKHREDISLKQVTSPGFQKVDVYWKMKIHDLNLLLSCK